jgi:ERCC4-type nuclease
LVKPLRDLGLQVDDTCYLDYGDIAFMGRGEGGKEVYIGIEHKKISDFIQSFVTTTRGAGHQLPGLVTHYDRAWLIIEGEWSHDEHGRASAWRGRGQRAPLRGAPPAAELERRIITLETRGGVKVRQCPSRRDTLRFLFALYTFWTDKALDEHKSHLAIHNPDLDRTLTVEVSDFRGAIARLPGVGYRVSAAIEQRCWDADKGEGSFEQLMRLSVADLAEIATLDDHGKERRLGTSRATKLKRALR